MTVCPLKGTFNRASIGPASGRTDTREMRWRSVHMVHDSRWGSTHCAGALITMEREGSFNQMMRIGERLGFYDPADLAMDAPVHDSLADWVATHDSR